MSPCPNNKGAQFVRNREHFIPLIRNIKGIFEWLTFTGIVAHFAPEYAHLHQIPQLPGAAGTHHFGRLWLATTEPGCEACPFANT